MFPDFSNSDRRSPGSIGRFTALSLLTILALNAHASLAIAQNSKLPAVVANSVKQDITKVFKVPASKLKVVDFSQQEWPDGCLNLPKPDEVCTQAIVPGWRVGISDGVQQYFYRTDRTGKTLRAETQPSAILPLTVAERVQAFAARELNIASNRLQIGAIAPRTFDGCLGIFTPNRACTKIALPGWQAVVTDGKLSWVYHLDRQAQRVVQNATASKAIAPVAIGFVGEVSAVQNRQTDTLDRNVVFTSSSSGDLTGRTITYTLTSDGEVTQLITAPNIRSRPVTIKTLTPQQIDRFKVLLNQQRFPNLNRLTYLTSAAVADVPTIVLRDANVRTSYISTEKAKLPRALRSVIDAWDRIITAKK